MCNRAQCQDPHMVKCSVLLHEKHNMLDVLQPSRRHDRRDGCHRSKCDELHSELTIRKSDGHEISWQQADRADLLDNRESLPAICPKSARCVELWQHQTRGPKTKTTGLQIDGCQSPTVHSYKARMPTDGTARVAPSRLVAQDETDTGCLALLGRPSVDGRSLKSHYSRSLLGCPWAFQTRARSFHFVEYLNPRISDRSMGPPRRHLKAYVAGRLNRIRYGTCRTRRLRMHGQGDEATSCPSSHPAPCRSVLAGAEWHRT